MTPKMDLSRFVKVRADGTAQIDLLIEGVTCGNCIGRIEHALKRMEGLLDARLNFTNHRLAVTFRAGVISPPDILSTIEGIGYQAHPFDKGGVDQEELNSSQRLLRCLAVAGFATMNIMLLSVSIWSGNATDISPETRDLFHGISALIALPTVAYAGQPFFRSALHALKLRQMNMDVPISVGVLLATGMSVFETVTHAEHAYFDSAVMLLFFLLCGRYLDQLARSKTKSVAANLAALKAVTAQRIEADGALVRVAAASLIGGDRVLIQPGDRIPADGSVTSGVSEIDESPITGETRRRTVRAGDLVYAGSLNFDGALILTVTSSGDDTLIDEIERLIENAAAAKSRYTRLADRVARAYAPVVHITAALTAFGWIAAGASFHDAIIVAIAVLIITCPCALALAVPAVQVVASGMLFRAGILLNVGDAIERLATVDTVVFDKTGTLTVPEARVANAASIPPLMLERAARLGLSSHHPLAAAVARHANQRVPYPDAVEEPGHGIFAVVEGIEMRLGSLEFCGVTVSIDETGQADMADSSIAFRHGVESAVLHVHQSLRADAVSTVQGLSALGFRMAIVSGDHIEAVGLAASQLGIANWRGGCKPAEKIAFIESLKTDRRSILMVGDGLNDAPALAAADVSLAPITATEVTQTQADAVFLGDRLRPVLDALVTCRHAHAIMRQNLWFALAYNSLAVPLAIAGMVTPLIAAAAMSASSILVTLNALRVRNRPMGNPRENEGRPANIEDARSWTY